MKTLKPVLGPAFLSLVVAGGAAAGSWTPDPNFRIEDGNYKETLIFVSALSYALAGSNEALRTAGLVNFYCLPGSHTVDSRLLVSILNAKHSGSITSEEATATVLRGLKDRYPCK